MKKSLALSIFLISILTLAACSEKQPSPNPTAALTAAPSGNIFTPVITPEPSDMPQISQKPFFNEIGSRYYLDVTLGLVAKNDYGRIYPYIGGFISSYSMEPRFLFGVVDSKGRIICDPVYSDVSVLNPSGNTEIYMFRKYGESKDENYALGGLFVFAATDGSWVRKFENAHYQRYTVSGEKYYDYIAVCQDGKWGAITYGGKDILPCIYDSPPLFNEGLAAILTGTGSYSYINTSGETVLGPYPLPPALQDFGGFDSDTVILDNMHFSDGRALYYEDGKYGFIDKSGNVIIPPQFNERYSRQVFDGGYVAVMLLNETGDAQYGVIDIDGNVIIPIEMDYVGKFSDDIFYFGKYGVTYHADLYGNVTEDDGFYPIGGGYESGTRDGHFTIRGNGTEIVFDKAHSATYLEDDKFIFYYSEPYMQRIESLNGKIYLEQRDQETTLNLNGDKIYTYSWKLQEPNPLTRYGKSGMLDLDGNILIPPEYNYLEPFGSNYLATQGYYGGLLDKNGNWIVKVSLMDYIPD